MSAAPRGSGRRRRGHDPDDRNLHGHEGCAVCPTSPFCIAPGVPRAGGDRAILTRGAMVWERWRLTSGRRLRRILATPAAMRRSGGLPVRAHNGRRSARHHVRTRTPHVQERLACPISRPANARSASPWGSHCRLAPRRAGIARKEPFRAMARAHPVAHLAAYDGSLTRDRAAGVPANRYRPVRIPAPSTPCRTTARRRSPTTWRCPPGRPAPQRICPVSGMTAAAFSAGAPTSAAEGQVDYLRSASTRVMDPVAAPRRSTASL